MNFARIWCITNPTPAWRVTPSWDVYMTKCDSGWEGYPVWQTGLPALTGHPTYHVNVINKLKWEIIWTVGLPHLSELPHLPGVPHLHVNRPSVAVTIRQEIISFFLYLFNTQQNSRKRPVFKRRKYICLSNTLPKLLIKNSNIFKQGYCVWLRKRETGQTFNVKERRTMTYMEWARGQ